MTKAIRQVETTILACANEIVRKRCSESPDKFLDPPNIKLFGGKKDRHFFTTCETLEILFQTMLYLDRADFLLKKHPKLSSRIKSDFDFLFDNAKSQDWKFFSGAPYLGDFRRITCEPLNSIEALVYFVTVAVHLLKVQKRVQMQLSGHTEDEIIEGITKSLQTLLDSYTGKGWPLILKKRTPDIYSTWSVLEALGELEFWQPQLHKNNVQSNVIEMTAQWLEEELRNGIRQESQRFLDKLPKEKDYKYSTVLRSTTCLYYLVQAITGLCLLGKGSPTFFGRVVGDLLNQKAYFLSEDFPTQYPHKLDDYTLVPLLLRCLCAILQTQLRAGIVDNPFVSGLGQVYEQRDLILYDLFWKLVSEKRTIDKAGKYNGLFYEPDPESPQANKAWELFYTQRTMEGLISYWMYLRDPEIPREPIITKPIPKSKVKAVAAEVRFPVELKTNLPALNVYSEILLGKNGTVLSKCVIICVQHFLLDLPPFVECLIKLGATSKDIFLLRKTYAYPDCEIVEDALKKLGCRVFKQPPVPTQWIHQRERLLRKALDVACSSRKKIVIVEDGGYFVPLAHEKFKEDLDQIRGAVEQTTRGLRNDKALGDALAIPVVNVAKSKLKSEEEAPAVAQTLADNVYNVCVSSAVSYRPTKTKVLVLGYGTIGSITAKQLANKNFKVAVYDNSPQRRKKAREDNFEVISGPNDFQNFKFVLGLTGNRSMPLEAIISLPHNAIIASGSSEYYEIDLEALEGATPNPKSRNINYDSETKLTSYQVTHDKRIRVLCDGEPINFSLSGGIPDVMIQPVLMQLLWGTTIVAAGQANPGRSMIIKFPTKVEKEIEKIRDRLED
jgi:S-adenosylhomocysteine hydrolase